MNSEPNDTPGCFTVWSEVRDHDNLLLFYKSFNNPLFKALDLKKLNLKKGAPVKKLLLMDWRGDWFTAVEAYMYEGKLSYF